MSEPPTVCTWYWRQPGGRTFYTEEHLAIWASMVRGNLSMPHRLAVVTHEEVNIPGVELIRPPREFEEVRVPTWGDRKPQCHRRLVMFRPDAERWFGPKVISMDLDCVVGGPLDPLFERDDDIVLFKGTTSSRPYNGSLLMLKTGSRPKVYEDFSPEGAVEASELFCGSDQAWLAHKLGWNEKTWDERDGVFWYNGKFRSQARAQCRLLFFPGKAKPWDLAKVEPYTRAHYRMKEAA